MITGYMVLKEILLSVARDFCALVVLNLEYHRIKDLSDHPVIEDWEAYLKEENKSTSDWTLEECKEFLTSIKKQKNGYSQTKDLAPLVATGSNE